jgi:hypothetical protein
VGAVGLDGAVELCAFVRLRERRGLCGIAAGGKGVIFVTPGYRHL